MFKSHMKRDDPLLAYINKHSVRLTPEQQELIQITKADSGSMMLGSADELQLLANLCRSIGAKRTLDIGVYTGYSALTIALALPEDGTVVAMDISGEKPKLGKPLWAKAGVEKKIDLRIAPALQTLEKLLAEEGAGSYDYAFIDADKTNYDQYYELCLKLIRPGGIIAVDNVLWNGKVVDPNSNDPNTLAIKKLNEKLAVDDRIHISMILIGDGVTLAFKK